MTQEQYIIAIDIAKQTLDVRSKTLHFETSNNFSGFQKLIKRHRKFGKLVVVCEATGGYERKLIEYLHEHDIAVVLVNPARIRAFAKSQGIKAKTDPIDSKMILQFAEQKQLRLTPKPDPLRVQILDLMDRRAHLVEHNAREKNRLEQVGNPIRSSVLRMIDFVKKEIAAIEEQIRNLITNDSLLCKQASLMTDVKGVGEVTAWTILAYLPEIGYLKRNQIVALVGVAPYNQDSGPYKGKRRIQGGREKIRTSLYNAARSAAAHNDIIKPYAQALQNRGKPYKATMVAVMRKLIIHLHIIMKNHYKSLA